MLSLLLCFSHRVFSRLVDAWPLVRRSFATPLKQVLVVRIDHMGDFVIWLDAARKLREVYPPDVWRITLLVENSLADYAGNYDYWDRVIGSSRWSLYNNPLARFHFLLSIKRYAFDAVLITNLSRSFYIEDSIVRASCAEVRTGFDTDLSNITASERKQGNACYTRLIERPAAYTPEYSCNLMMMVSLGASAWQPEPAQLVFNATEASDGSFDYVLLPGSGSAYKNWDTSRFAELADRIYTQAGFRGALLGASPDKSLACSIKQESRAPLVDLTGQTSINGLISIINGVKFIVGNDSGGIHIAVALATPSVAILGGGHFQRFMPYPESVLGAVSAKIAMQQMECFQCDWKCKYTLDKSKPYRCIEGVSVDAVWEQVQAIIDTL